MSEVPNSYPHLFYGYLVIWGLMIVYMLRLHLKMKSIEKRLTESEHKQ